MPTIRSSSGRVIVILWNLVGEAMLNFGAFAVIPAFLLYGLLMAGLHRFVMGMEPDDARVLVAPFAVILSILLLTSDFDNLLWFACKTAGIPALFVYLSTRHPGGFRRMTHLAAS